MKWKIMFFIPVLVFSMLLPSTSATFDVRNVYVCKSPPWSDGGTCENWKSRFSACGCTSGTLQLNPGENIYVYWEIYDGQESNGCYWWYYNPWKVYAPAGTWDYSGWETKVTSSCPPLYGYMCMGWGLGPLTPEGSYRLEGTVINMMKATLVQDSLVAYWNVGAATTTTTTTVPGCTDSDNGQNALVAGSCTDSIGTANDKCYLGDNTKVIEHYCVSNRCYGIDIICPSGYVCEQDANGRGRCIESAAPPAGTFTLIFIGVLGGLSLLAIIAFIILVPK